MISFIISLPIINSTFIFMTLTRPEVQMCLFRLWFSLRCFSLMFSLSFSFKIIHENNASSRFWITCNKLSKQDFILRATLVLIVTSQYYDVRSRGSRGALGKALALEQTNPSGQKRKCSSLKPVPNVEQQYRTIINIS